MEEKNKSGEEVEADEETRLDCLAFLHSNSLNMPATGRKADTAAEEVRHCTSDTAELLET